MQTKRRFFIGQYLDVLDTVKSWLNAEVLRVTPHELYVHYTGWKPSFDEWIPVESNRILLQWQAGKEIQVNNRLDVRHDIGGWLEARVIEKEQQRVKVHFHRYHPKYDMWVELTDKDRVAEIGRHSKAFGVGKKRGKYAVKLNEMVLGKRWINIEKLKQCDKDFRESLKSKNMMIKEMGADGNCLFRSISDQLYGNESHYREIRELCMDYIEGEKSFFENYIEGDFQLYVERKRQDGEWGDDVEIQAVSELYNRPIEIFVNGVTPIKTFHEENERMARPLKLAYHGRCHYNSIKQEGRENDGLLDTKFGVYEKSLASGQFKGRREVARDQFASTACVDERLKSVMSPEEQKKEQQQINEEIIKMCETDMLLQEIEKAEMKEIERKEEEDKMKEEIKLIEARELEEIKKQSLMETRGKEELWLQSIRQHGFSDEEIMFAVNAKGNDPDAVLNYLYDNF